MKFLKTIFIQLKKDYRLIFFKGEARFETAANKNYWLYDKKKFGATLNNFQAFRAKFLKKILSQQGYQSVLDLGSGDGSIQIYLRSELKGVSFTVSDSSPEVIEYLISKGFNCLDIDLDRHTELQGDYDVVTAFEVFEHLSDTERVLQNAVLCAKHELIFSVPNTGYFPYRLRLLLLGKVPAQWRVHPGEHLRFWSLRDLDDWLRSISLPDCKIEIKGYMGWPKLGYFMPNLFCMGAIVRIVKLNRENKA